MTNITITNTSSWFDFPTNYSNGTLSVDGVGRWMQYTSSIVGDGFGLGMVIIIWIMSFGLSMVLGSRKATLAASFITFVFSVYFYMLEIINLAVPFILLTLVIVSIVFEMKSSPGGL